jgi:hypothetical protein
MLHLFILSSVGHRFLIVIAWGFLSLPDGFLF